MKKRVHVFISGRVQGVFFRSFIKEKAVEHCVSGWVRNLPTGGVETVLEGDEDSISRLVEEIKVGSIYSRVEKVEVQVEGYKGEFRGFEIRYF